ncbi:MAG: DUF4340 domain-containing protein [Betaproteobacteria bacterium]|jgi:hypothetical protein|nr:DUF4340 domain-containing protein [Betaproteobacteria bacterium]
MLKGWRLNLLLFAVVLALAAVVAYRPAKDAAPATLSAVKPAAVGNMALLRPGRPPIELRQREGRWWIEAPFKARADEFLVLRLLSILEARPLSQLPGGDLKRYELDLPQAVLDIDGVSYAFGAINPVTSEQYLRAGDRIYAIELRHGAALPARAQALVRRVLLDEDERPLAVILPQAAVRKVEGRWQREPAAHDPGGDDLQIYVDRWRQASAAAAEPHDGRTAIADIRLELEGGRSVVFGILQRSPQLVLWRRDNGLQYTLLEAAGRALLEVPGELKK